MIEFLDLVATFVVVAVPVAVVASDVRARIETEDDSDRLADSHEGARAKPPRYVVPKNES